jgi:hypothetical protein
VARRSLVPLLILAGAALVVGLFFVLRPAEESVTPPTTTVATATTAEPATTQTKTVTFTLLRVTVRDGAAVDGIRRAAVPKGRRVGLVVDADVSDHVHIHGYDLMRDVGPGRRARIDFRATIVGRFEIELEDRGLLIAELEVRP